MRTALTLATVVCVSSVVFACGSDGGVGTVGGTGEDGGNDTGNTSGDGGNPDQDGTIPPGELDASLDVNFPDGFYGPDTSLADGASGTDAGCAPAGITCTGTVADTCDTSGNLTTFDCASISEVCADGYGCVVCTPGSGSCKGSLGSLCKSDGSGYITNDCDPLLGLTCSAGICLGTCSASSLGTSYIGCDYYAATLSNPALDQSTFYASVSIANTGSSTAKVTVTGPAAFSATYSVASGVIQEVKLPWDNNLSVQYGSTLEKGGAYRIRSTQPVTVYQFNARDYQIGGVYSYTNDASILIPSNAMTGNYYVATMPDWLWSGGTHYPGTISIIATVDSTTVKFTPVGNVTAGGGVSASGMSTVTMNRGDVLEIAGAKDAPSSLTYGSDPSGATVAADQPVEVFGGSTCSFIPANVGYCDHTEEVQFPQETLRTDYIVVPPNNTVAAPRLYVRIVGTAAGTTLTYAPSTPTGAPLSLNAGQVGVFEAKAPFEVTTNAKHPVVVAEYMEGEDNFGTSNVAGDPAMSMAVAKDQYRTSYTFTAPNNYAVNYATVTAPTGSSVTLDGALVGGWTAIGATGYSYAYVKLSLSSSNHSASSASQFGVEVYGYGNYTSYWYPGGLNLKR
jgi:hypothetical protein